MNYQNRIEQVKQGLAEQEKDALIAVGPADSFYFSGFHTVSDGNYPAVVIPQEGDAHLLVSPLDRDAAAYASSIDLVVPKSGFADAIIEVLPDDGEVLVGKNVSIGLYNKLAPEVSLEVDEQIITDIRTVKEDTEISRIRDAYRLTEDALTAVTGRLESGMTETTVAADLEYHMRQHGSQGTAFPTIVATGASSSMPHHVTANAEIGTGPLLFDMGATVDGYRSDISRTFHIGEPDDTFVEVYDIVQESQQRAENMLKPGVAVKDVDAAARDHIEEHGFGDNFPHSTGHGVGISVHEDPNVSYRSDTTLEPGMVITVEPGIYLKGDFGVRIEDAYVITENGADRITETSRKLQTLELA